MRTRFFCLALFAASCGPAQKPTDAVGEHTSVTPEVDTDTPATTDGSATPSAPPPASASAAPTAAPADAGPAEATKEANALVIELTVEGGKSGLGAPEIDALKKEFEKLVAKSTRIALPTSKGIEKGRHVATRLVVPAIEDAKGNLSQKLQIVGVTSNGKCPLFDLGGQASMGGGKKDNKDDVLAVRAAALTQVFQKLENEAPTLKPQQSCTPEDKKKN